MSTESANGGFLIDLSHMQIAALSAVMMFAFAAPLGLAFNVEAIAAAFSTTNTAAGGVATAEMLMISVSSLITAQFAPRINPRQIILMALAILIPANLLSIFAGDIVTLGATRALAGIGAGAVIALVMTIAGRSRGPTMAFGVINSGLGVGGMAIAMVLPRAIGEYGLSGTYWVYMAAAILALPIIRLLPVPPAHAAATAQDAPPPALGLSAWMALLGVAFIFMGHTALMLFGVRIGMAIPLPLEKIGTVFLAASTFAAIAPLVAGYLGSRLPATVPALLILASLAVLAYVLAGAHTPLSYYSALPLFAALPLALAPIALGAFATVDPTGRMTGAYAAFVTLGAAIAPFLGGFTADLGGYALTGWFTIVCVAIGGTMLFGTAGRADKLRREAG